MGLFAVANWTIRSSREQFTEKNTFNTDTDTRNRVGKNTSDDANKPK
jgi:hypothetical protein